MQPNVLVIDFVNTSTPAHDQALVNQIIAGATEASRMQGFKKHVAAVAAALSGLEVRRPARRRQRPPGGAGGLPVPEQHALSGHRVGPQLGRHCRLLAVLQPGVRQSVRLPGSRAAGPVADAVRAGRSRHGSRAVGASARATYPTRGMAEVLESKQRYTSSGAKIAGSFERCAGNGCFETTVPICGRSIRIGLVNLHSRARLLHPLARPRHGVGAGRHPVALGRRAIQSTRRSRAWFAPFANLDLDTKYGLPFRNLMVRVLSRQPGRRRVLFQLSDDDVD